MSASLWDRRRAWQRHRAWLRQVGRGAASTEARFPPDANGRTYLRAVTTKHGYRPHALR